MSAKPYVFAHRKGKVTELFTMTAMEKRARVFVSMGLGGVLAFALTGAIALFAPEYARIAWIAPCFGFSMLFVHGLILMIRSRNA